MAKENFAKVEDFIGLSKHRAHDLAEAKNMIFQLVMVDGDPYLSYPPDTEALRADRVYIELTSGKVTKATIR